MTCDPHLDTMAVALAKSPAELDDATSCSVALASAGFRHPDLDEVVVRAAGIRWGSLGKPTSLTQRHRGAFGLYKASEKAKAAITEAAIRIGEAERRVEVVERAEREIAADRERWKRRAEMAEAQIRSGGPSCI